MKLYSKQKKNDAGRIHKFTIISLKKSLELHGKSKFKIKKKAEEIQITSGIKINVFYKRIERTKSLNANTN